MANNQYVNKVVYDNNTLIDITDTTATAEDVASGKTFYAADGSRTLGTSNVQVDQTFDPTSPNAISGVGVNSAVGTGLSVSNGKINHSNSVTAKTTQAVYPIKFDAQGHITASGSAVSIPAAVAVKGNAETDYRTGNVNLTAANIGASALGHAHGKITNAGDITTNVAIASGDRLVINDESASQLNNSSITFGTSTATFLSNKGTWATPAGAFKGINTDSQLASYTSAFTYTANQDAYAIGTLEKGDDEMVVTLNGKTINQSTYGIPSTSTYSFICIPLKNGDILKATHTTCNVKVYKIK